MTENQRLKILKGELKFKSQLSFASALGLSPGTMSDILREKPGVGVSANTKRILENSYNINIDWLETGEGDMFKSLASESKLNEPYVKYNVAPNPRLEAKPLHLASDPNDFDNDGKRFEDLGDGTIRMRVPIIPFKAYAGYLRGFQDPEFYEDLKTISVDVYKEHAGHYIAFEVAGDSMMTTDPGLFEYMALPGWKAVGRDLLRHHWKYKLHTHRTDTWIIVHNTEGILIKQITNHDVEASTITIHSLNPAYPDEVLQLNDIAQIFSVVKYIIDK